MHQRLFHPNDQMPMDPCIHHGKLNNGLRYYVAPNPYPKEHVVIRLQLRIGSVQGTNQLLSGSCLACVENDGEEGVARFIEQMSARGTESFSETDVRCYATHVP